VTADLRTEFRRLVPPRDEGGAGTVRFTAVPIPGFERHRLAINAAEDPCLLVAVDAAPRTAAAPPLALEHLTVQHDVECRVMYPDGSTERGHFTLICCAGGDRALEDYFLSIVGSLVGLVGELPTAGEVNAVVTRVVELFQAMSRPERKSVQGLWAELFVIARSRDVSRMVRAWHVVPADRFDFNEGPARVEVKSTSGPVRQHQFSLDQLVPPADARALVVSVRVERAGAGTSLGELVGEVKAGLRGDALLSFHVDEIVMQTLGSAWRRALDERFDRQVAEDDLAFFDPAVIPRVDEKLPPGVSDVRFRVDLAGVPTVSTAQYRREETLFRCMR
jgi:Putative  PD-(D/E)XK family member, (DUF4420)